MLTINNVKDVLLNKDVANNIYRHYEELNTMLTGRQSIYKKLCILSYCKALEDNNLILKEEYESLVETLFNCL